MSQSMQPVRHMVLCKFSRDVTPERRAAFFEQIRRLTEVPGIEFSNFQGGPNVSPEGYAMGFADGFMMDFASRNACFSYLAHPTHHAIGERLIEALDGGVQGLMVFDIDLEIYENPARKTRPVLDQHRDPRASRTAQQYD